MQRLYKRQNTAGSTIIYGENENAGFAKAERCVRSDWLFGGFWLVVMFLCALYY